MKRILSLIISACMLFSFTAFASDTAVSEESIVQTIKAVGIMRGDQHGNMALERNISRAEFVKMMVSASSHKDSVSTEGIGFSLFSDVKNSHWASEYIRIAVNERWVVGYTDGTFRPEKTITLEEACTALLRLLGYSSENLAGSFPYAQLNKADAVGLRDMVSAVKGQQLTRRDCMYLFYNLLTAKNTSGLIYATTLGYNVSAGKVDYMSIITEEMEGPYVAQGVPTVPFDTTYATVYRDGKASSMSAIAKHDVYYYNTDMKTVWVYTDRVSGKLTSVSPNATSPTSVIVGGKNYVIETSDAQYKLSALSGVKTGDVVTLLLGMNGTVVDVLKADETNAVYYGVVQSAVKGVNTDDNAAIKVKVTVACTDDSIRTYELDKDVKFSKGDIVTVSLSSGTVKVNLIVNKTLTGTVNRDATALGSYTFADDIQVMDVSKEGDSAIIDVERLAGVKFTNDSIRYYALNARGEISHLILNDVTGDTWTYGYMIDISKIPGMGDSVSTVYTYMLNGAPQVITNSAIKFTATTGGIAIRYDTDGTIKSMKNISYVKLVDLNANTARSENKTFIVSDDVQVYLKQDDEYYFTDLSTINAEDYNLVGHYDDSKTGAGGLIRIIIATEK